MYLSRTVIAPLSLFLNAPLAQDWIVPVHKIHFALQENISQRIFILHLKPLIIKLARPVSLHISRQKSTQHQTPSLAKHSCEFLKHKLNLSLLPLSGSSGYRGNATELLLCFAEQRCSLEDLQVQNQAPGGGSAALAALLQVTQWQSSVPHVGMAGFTSVQSLKAPLGRSPLSSKIPKNESLSSVMVVKSLLH